jgi:hypothetical protein
MQANATGIRQNFADVRLRWDKAKLKKSRVFWIAIGAIVLTLWKWRKNPLKVPSLPGWHRSAWPSLMPMAKGL